MEIPDSYFKERGLERVSSNDQPEVEKEVAETPEPQEVKDEAVEEKPEAEAPEVEKEVEKSEEAVVSFEETFKEKYGSEEDLDNKLRSLTEEIEKKTGLESKFDEEGLSRLEKILEGGLSWDKIGEIAKIQTLNVESLTDEQALAKSLELKDGLSADEIKYKLYERATI